MRCHFIIAEFFNAYDELTPTHVYTRLDFRGTKVISLGNLRYNLYDIFCSKGKQYESLKWSNRNRWIIKAF